MVLLLSKERIGSCLNDKMECKSLFCFNSNTISQSLNLIDLSLTKFTLFLTLDLADILIYGMISFANVKTMPLEALRLVTNSSKSLILQIKIIKVILLLPQK